MLLVPGLPMSIIGVLLPCVAHVGLLLALLPAPLLSLVSLSRLSGPQEVQLLLHVWIPGPQPHHSSDRVRCAGFEGGVVSS